MSSDFTNSLLIPYYFPLYSVIKHLGSERAARAYVRNDGSWCVESHVNYDGMKSKVSGLKEKWLLGKIFSSLSRKFFHFVNIFSTSVLEHFGLWKVGIINDFSLILVSYYLTNSLKINQISFKKWIKIVYFLLISHNFVLISNKTSSTIPLRPHF